MVPYAVRKGQRPAQLDALAAAGIPREKIFAEKVSTRVRVRPELEKALEACRQIKAHAPHCRVILTVYEMKRLGRDSAELTALADHLTAHGIALEILAGPHASCSRASADPR
jgi:DNA invertase Pin-like site-specific DNA recombinase